MDLASIGAIDGGGCARLALTDEDAAGRDLVVAWMHDLGLIVTTDVIGNVIGSGIFLVPAAVLAQSGESVPVAMSVC